MLRTCLRILLSSLAMISVAWAQNDIDATIIKQATCAFFTEQILGWRFSKEESQQWTKGFEENGQLGSRATVGDRRIRAVALGTESDYVVFMTLRSFIDPIYPNPAILGVNGSLTDQEKNEINFSDGGTDRSKYVRYGRIRLVWYEDLGGGASKINRVINAVTEFDKNAPKRYDDLPSWKVWQSPEEEEFNSGKYKRPHEAISVADHVHLQQLGTNKAELRFFENHDIVLIYLPKKLFETQKQTLPPTLGLQCPTVSTDLALRKSEKLFGFKFNLIGEETLGSIRSYRPANDSPKYPGLEKLVDIAGLALAPSTFQMLKYVDKAVNTILPNTRQLTSLKAKWEVWHAIGNVDLLNMARLIAPLMVK